MQKLLRRTTSRKLFTIHHREVNNVVCFRILVRDSTVYYDMMRTAPPGTALHELFNQRVKDNPDAKVRDAEAAALKMVDDEMSILFNGASAFAGDKRIQALMGLPEQLTDPLAFALRKNSELTPVFNQAIQEMKQAGLIDKIEKKWW